MRKEIVLLKRKKKAQKKSRVENIIEITIKSFLSLSPSNKINEDIPKPKSYQDRSH